MSISATLSNAMSGLNMSSRAAELVSSNLANAMTDGYGRRLLEISSRGHAGGGGVQVDGVTRVSDPRLVHDRRASEAETAAADVGAQSHARVLAAIGTPDDAMSLNGFLAEFSARLTMAASDPAVDLRLSNAVTAAADLVGAFNRISGAIQEERMTAEAGIARAVEDLNTDLRRVHSLNIDIARTRVTGGDSSALEDQRQRVIDRISELVPVREFRRANGVVALMSERGQILLDGPPKEFSFVPSNQITPYQSLAAATLSGLAYDGVPVATEITGKLGGGRLAALFNIRDVDMVAAQSELDAVARNLIERFQDPAVDPTLAPGDPGLFTDAGGAFASTDEIGISARLRLNNAIDPATNANSAWRLRDGLQAFAPGPVGNASILTAMQGGLERASTVGSGSGAGQTATMARLFSGVTARFASLADTADRNLTFSMARSTELVSLERAGGVDSDEEMQKLLVIERLYAANARVIEAVDSMLDSLMRI